jgi:tetrahydromethanopterin S-methyltransferase subunit A
MEIMLKAGGFFAANIFSQNEVESLADRYLSQLELIDAIDAERIGELNTQIKNVGVQLSGNTTAIQPLQSIIATGIGKISCNHFNGSVTRSPEFGFLEGLSS